jgi:hypothetical protein
MIQINEIVHKVELTVDPITEAFNIEVTETLHPVYLITDILPTTNGATGATGAQGEKGDTGLPGINGTNGIDGIDGTTGASIYDGASPTTVKAGGLEVGSDIANKTFSQIIESIVAPFVAPAFSAFSISSQATTVESGTTISGNKTFTIGFSQIGNITPASLEISDSTTNTILGSDLSVSANATLNIGSVLISGNLTVHRWRAKATNVNNTLFSSTEFAITSKYKQFFGAATPPTTSSQVRALAGSNFVDGQTNFIISILTNDYCIAIPDTKSITSIISANTREELFYSGGFVQSPTRIMVADASGTNQVSYKVYNFHSSSVLGTNATVTIG